MLPGRIVIGIDQKAALGTNPPFHHRDLAGLVAGFVQSRMVFSQCSGEGQADSKLLAVVVEAV
jgi:hypothetical protein